LQGQNKERALLGADMREKNIVLFVETKILVYDKYRDINILNILRNISIVLLSFSKKYNGEVKIND